MLLRESNPSYQINIWAGVSCSLTYYRSKLFKEWYSVTPRFDRGQDFHFIDYRKLKKLLYFYNNNVFYKLTPSGMITIFDNQHDGPIKENL